MTVAFDGLELDWLGYATTRLASDDSVVYTDPGRYGVLTGEWESKYGGVSHPSGAAYDERDGDVVVITHDHHYDSDGVRRVASDDATVIVYESVDAERVTAGGRDVEPPESLPYDVRRVSYGDELDVDGVGVDVVPAYNEPDGRNANEDGSVGHPRGFGCGFVLTLGDRRCFWTGDSDVIEEHADVDASVLLPSIARTITMNRHEAADLAETVAPDLVLPIHYNTFEGLRADSGAFASDVAGRSIPVVLDEAGLR